MRLLLDQNLSHRLVERLAQAFPGSVHVRELDMSTADDATIWAYAQRHRLAIVSKDSDFHQRSLLYGHPPKVVWIQRGNCSTLEIEELLLERRSEIEDFLRDAEAAFLILG